MALDGGIDLFHHGVGLLLINRLGQRELAHQDGAGLAQHALLAGRKATVLVATPQVANDLGDLIDIAGGQALLVSLITAGPVASLFNVLVTQHGKDLFQALLAHDVAHADVIGVLDGHADD